MTTALLYAVLALVGPDGDAPPRVALAELEEHGVTPAEAKGVAAQIEATLGRGRYDVVKLAAKCTDAACWGEAGREAGAQFVVLPRLRRDASDHAIAIAIIDVRNGSVVAEANDTCDLCGRSELVDLAGDLGDKTRRRLDQLAGEPGVLALASTPRGATVSVDGEVVGTTPLEHPLSPGRHEIRVELDGHQTLVRTTDVVGGTREAMSFELLPRPSAGSQTGSGDRGPSRRPLVAAGAGVLVAGLAGVGVGAALVAIHATPIEGDCSADNVDPDGDCRFLHNTRGGGIAALALGGAGVIAGAVLLGVGLHRSRAAKKVRASATPMSFALEVTF